MEVVEGTFAAENNTEIYTILSTANNGEIKFQICNAFHWAGQRFENCGM